MSPRIEELPVKYLIGKQVRMNLQEDRTAELWRSFMPRRNEIKNRVSRQVYSLQVYDKLYDINDFGLKTTFTKWAAIEVTDFDEIPAEMEAYILPSGLYAIFIYKGIPTNFFSTWKHIFQTWLPSSGYSIDNRPHFELLEESYKPNDPNAEEEIWIPIKTN